jgi:hypothetical protein
MPTVCDLTADDTARRLLAAWLRRPYDPFFRDLLADRAEELGFAGAAAHLRSLYVRDAWHDARKWPRRARQRQIRWWRCRLAELYGDPAPPLETNTLPVEVPADTPLPF